MTVETQQLYHCFEPNVSAGSIIQPGRFGRRVFADGTAHRRWGQELAFELVRFEFYRQLPSRLYCNYLTETLDAALFYVEHMAPNWVVYRAEIVDLTQPTHRTDFNRKRCPEHIGFRFDSGRLPQVMWQSGLQ